MREHAQAAPFEPRWPVALAMFAVLFLLAILPDRVRLFPVWFTNVVGMAVLLSIAAVGLTAAKVGGCASRSASRPLAADAHDQVDHDREVHGQHGRAGDVRMAGHLVDLQRDQRRRDCDCQVLRPALHHQQADAFCQ
jgi:hypothetical protein